MVPRNFRSTCSMHVDRNLALYLPQLSGIYGAGVLPFPPLGAACAEIKLDIGPIAEYFTAQLCPTPIFDPWGYG